MSVFEAIILGIIQGIAEFLPISSSGHLALGKHFFGIDEGGLLFIIVIHIATLVPVFIIYWGDIWQLIKKPFQKMTLLLIIATFPAVIVGLFLEDFVETAFASLNMIAIGLIITGIALTLTDKIKDTNKSQEKITKFDAAIVGIAQAIAIMPGISRSGSTITAGLFRKINRSDVAKFSFLMSIPAILGAMVLQIIHIFTGRIEIEYIEWMPMIAGFVAAALSGYLAIQFLLAIIKRAKLKYFAYYVWAVALLVIATNF